MKCGRFGTATFADFIVFGDTIGPRSEQAMRWWICATAVALSVAVLPGPVFANPAAIDWDQVTSEAIEKLQGYIRVDTTNPPGNETPAAELLRGWLAAEGIDARLYDPMRNPDRQALVARIPGRSNSTIVLMSHSDVVPAAAGDWSHPPFGAEIAEGILYGRGVLDTKELGIFQLMTLLLLHRYGITPRDSLLLLIEPDEEEASRGVQGMLERYPELFRDVSLVLNEGGSGVTGTFKAGQAIYFVQTAEKGVAWMRLKARGDAGHGSIPLRNNAVATMARALERISTYEPPLRPAPPVVRLFATLADQQPFPTSWVMRHVGNPLVQQLFRRRLTERPLVSAMLRTTIAPTGVHGGYKMNVIPGEVEASLDCRVTVGDSGETLKRELEHVVDDPCVTIELTQNTAPNESAINEDLMAAVRKAAAQYVPGSLVVPLMSSGVTDSAAFRRRNVPAYGFNPVVITEAELAATHGRDERLRVDQFRPAVRMYYEVVKTLSGADSDDIRQ
jgi:acetylornithine deacetylase/succinyl-diaminopimelate desuccinylase-like protein